MIEAGDCLWLEISDFLSSLRLGAGQRVLDDLYHVGRLLDDQPGQYPAALHLEDIGIIFVVDLGRGFEDVTEQVGRGLLGVELRQVRAELIASLVHPVAGHARGDLEELLAVAIRAARDCRCPDGRSMSMFLLSLEHC